MIRACIKSKTHYLDIAGEVPEMESAFQFHEEAQKAGIVIMPAAGFGVVPTDLAAKLASELVEDPSHLIISYATQGGASRGTLKTVLKDIQKPGVVLQNGQYTPVNPAEKELTINILDQKFNMVYNPWRADLFTAKISTGITNIETYSEFPGFVVSMMKGKLGWLRNLILNYLINILPEGPTDKQINKGKTFVKATAKNHQNETGVVELIGPEAYLFTMISLEQMLQLIFKKEHLNGFLTPSQLDKEWIKDFDGIQIKIHQ